MKNQLKVRLKRSGAGRKPEHRATLKGLGFTKVNQVREVPDTPEVRGMINAVSYLVEVIDEGRKA